MKQDITKQSSSMLVHSNAFIEKLSKYAEATKLDFDEYQKTCVANAIRKTDDMLASSGMSWNDLDVNNVFNVLQQIGFLRLNTSANEVALITRNQKRGDDWVKTLEAMVMSNGNDTILKTFGQDVDTFKSYDVFEGDDFTGVEYDGWEVKLPKFKPNFKSRKVLYAVYIIRKTDGEFEVAISEREDAKVSLIAHAKSNMGKDVDEDLLRELSKLSLDEILGDKKWLDYKLKSKYGDRPLFSPAWTNPMNTEKMISRKLRNHAIRRYPKNFDKTEIAELYHQTFEDEKYIKENVIDHVEDVMETSQGKYDTEANKENVKIEKSGEKFEVKEEQEEPKQEVKTEKPKPEKEKVDKKEKAEMPDWM
jgi:hypothetical protein